MRQRVGSRQTHLSHASGSKINSEHQNISWHVIEDFDDEMAEVHIKSERLHA